MIVVVFSFFSMFMGKHRDLVAYQPLLVLPVFVPVVLLLSLRWKSMAPSNSLMAMGYRFQVLHSRTSLTVRVRIIASSGFIRN